MFDANGNLHVFENFRRDYHLPKYKKNKKASSNVKILQKGSSDDEPSEDETSAVFTFSSNDSWSNNRIVLTENTGIAVVQNNPSDRWYKKAWRFLRRKLESPPVPVDEFFRSVKNSVEELTVVNARADGYQAAIQQAHENGQMALLEQLQHSLLAVRAETQLLAIGLTKYLEEATLVEFVKKAKKGLRLDWIANFTRILPKHAVVSKRNADEREIFDNYVILHYDPDAKSWSETEAEKAARKDPILFGLIEGRRRLYFVDEWIDEYCDLSLDEIADTLGQESISAIDKEAFS